MSTEFVKAEAVGPSGETEHSLGIFSSVPPLILPFSAEFVKAEAGDPSSKPEHSFGIFSFVPV